MLNIALPPFVVISTFSVIIFGGALLLGYLLAIFFDRCFKTDDATISSGGTEGVAQKCGLHFMTKEERRRVLQKCLDTMTYGQQASEAPELNVSLSKRSDGATSSNNSIDYSSMVLHNGAVLHNSSENLKQESKNCRDKSFSKNNNSEEQSNPSKEIETDDCAICLTAYEKGDKVISSQHCSHLFHPDCALDWLQTHDACPICRVEAFSAEELREAARLLFGKQEFNNILKRRSIPSIQQCDQTFGDDESSSHHDADPQQHDQLAVTNSSESTSQSPSQSMRNSVSFLPALLRDFLSLSRSRNHNSSQLQLWDPEETRLVATDPNSSH